MNLENIQKFINIAKAEGVAELKYEEKDVKISVNFTSGSSQFIQHVPSAPAVSVQAPSAINPEQKPAQSDASLHTVTSPFVGTFYSQPAPGKPAFVKVGDKISKGQTICILEAMKIMNEIESDVSGEVIEICCDNESLVEYGQAIIKVRV